MLSVYTDSFPQVANIQKKGRIQTEKKQNIERQRTPQPFTQKNIRTFPIPAFLCPKDTAAAQEGTTQRTGGKIAPPSPVSIPPKAGNSKQKGIRSASGPAPANGGKRPRPGRGRRTAYSGNRYVQANRLSPANPNPDAAAGHNREMPGGSAAGGQRTRKPSTGGNTASASGKGEGTVSPLPAPHRNSLPPCRAGRQPHAGELHPEEHRRKSQYNLPAEPI